MILLNQIGLSFRQAIKNPFLLLIPLIPGFIIFAVQSLLLKYKLYIEFATFGKVGAPIIGGQMLRNVICKVLTSYSIIGLWGFIVLAFACSTAVLWFLVGFTYMCRNVQDNRAIKVGESFAAAFKKLPLMLGCIACIFAYNAAWLCLAHVLWGTGRVVGYLLDGLAWLPRITLLFLPIAIVFELTNNVIATFRHAIIKLPRLVVPVIIGLIIYFLWEVLLVFASYQLITFIEPTLETLSAIFLMPGIMLFFIPTAQVINVFGLNLLGQILIWSASSIILYIVSIAVFMIVDVAVIMYLLNVYRNVELPKSWRS